MKRGTVHLVSLHAARERDVTEDGANLRPVVVVSRESINTYGAAVIVCPLVDASAVERLYPSDVAVRAPEGGLTSDSVVLTGQLRAIGRTQLVRHLGELSEDVMRQVDDALRITLNLE